MASERAARETHIPLKLFLAPLLPFRLPRDGFLTILRTLFEEWECSATVQFFHHTSFLNRSPQAWEN